MLCRSEERGKNAVALLTKEKERDLDLMLCDLGSYKQITAFAI
jgi:hypothetical protein